VCPSIGGGDGSKDQPGIRWWLEFLRDRYGSYVPSASATVADKGRGTGMEVGRWERFETVVKNRKEYSDPFADVVLNAVYTRPDGSKVEFRGFYDGGEIWRIHFMPDVLGLWRYKAIFSDGQTGTSGEFHCVKSGVRGMISSFESNPVWFGFKENGPVLIRSFHVGDKFFAENFPISRLGTAAGLQYALGCKPLPQSQDRRSGSRLADSQSLECRNPKA
jgi:hypothetical protein